jgi:HSP20 family protein
MMREMKTLRREVNRVFGDFGLDRDGLFRSAFLPGQSTRGYPLVNMYEDGEAVHVEALAPGIAPEALDVELTGDTLTISGEKKPLEGVKPEAYHRNERAAGKFVRTLQLGTRVDDAKIKADYKSGILHVTLPKAEGAKPKQIAVKAK